MRRALTLVELIVVSAIFAAIIALLVPAVHRVKAVESRTACLDQMRRIAQATMAYAKDHAGDVPFSSVSTPPPNLPPAIARHVPDSQTTAGRVDHGGGNFSPSPPVDPPRVSGPIGLLLDQQYLPDWKIVDCPSAPQRPRLSERDRVGYMMNPHPAHSSTDATRIVMRYKKLSDMPAWRCLVVDFIYSLDLMPHNDNIKGISGVNMAFPDGHAVQSDNKDVYTWALKLPNKTFGWNWVNLTSVTGFHEHLLAKMNPAPARLGAQATPGGGSFFDPFDPPVAP